MSPNSKQAEIDIRRRNRELLALNAHRGTARPVVHAGRRAHARAGQGHGTFRRGRVSRLFPRRAPRDTLKLAAHVGYRIRIQRAARLPSRCPLLFCSRSGKPRATLLSGSAPALPEEFRELQRKEGILVSQIVVLWAKDRIMGMLVVGVPRNARIFHRRIEPARSRRKSDRHDDRQIAAPRRNARSLRNAAAHAGAAAAKRKNGRRRPADLRRGARTQ